jgi:hemoglobin-like flavoprotein
MDLTDDAAIVTDTLEKVSQKVGDPTSYVFARLFREIPETEALFIRDPNGLVRGQMFQMTMDSLLDFLGDRTYGAALIQIERVNHQGLGVETDMFDRFYDVVRASFQEILGPDWTPGMTLAWNRVLDALTARGGDQE